MRYSVWDTAIGGRLGRFSSEEEALALVRTMLATYPRQKLRSLSLGWRDERGNVGEARSGDDLLGLAERDADEQTRRGAEEAPSSRPARAGVAGF